MKSVLITGANRGIGLEFTRQCLDKGWIVFAGCRNPKNASLLHELAQVHGNRLHVLLLDVTNDCHINNAAQYVEQSSGSLDLLINNAGCFAPGEEGLHTVDASKMLYVFHVNTVGPVILTKACAALLQKGKRSVVVNLVSGAGVLTSKEKVPNTQYSYGASKAALNMVVRNMAADLKSQNVIAVGIGPGFVLTDMTKGNPNKPSLLPKDSVAGSIHTIEKLTLDDTGKFFGYDGKECDWMK